MHRVYSSADGNKELLFYAFYSWRNLELWYILSHFLITDPIQVSTFWIQVSTLQFIMQRDTESRN